MVGHNHRSSARSYWVNTYHPLASTPNGPWRHHQPPLPPYVDASCRREPDFEADFPPVTGLCRPPSVRCYGTGDLIFYFTVKANYGPRPAHRRLTAVLQVRMPCTNHEEAAEWISKRSGSRLPTNLIVDGNDALPLQATEGFHETILTASGRKVRVPVHPKNASDEIRLVARWDALYKKRLQECPDVCICEPLWRDLQKGRQVDDALIPYLFAGPFPNTWSRPQSIEKEVARRLLRFLNVRWPPRKP